MVQPTFSPSLGENDGKIISTWNFGTQLQASHQGIICLLKNGTQPPWKGESIENKTQYSHRRF
jgi:hypothetical protein